MQVILAPKSGGLWFCSTSECREAAFPWTASHIACSGVTGSAVAVITKPSRGQESWLHILDGNTQTHGHPCAPAAGRAEECCRVAPVPAWVALYPLLPSSSLRTSGHWSGGAGGRVCVCVPRRRSHARRPVPRSALPVIPVVVWQL